MLQVRNISFSYQKKTPLIVDLDCKVHPGEIVGLPGKSGCGKSTIGRIMAGYHTPQSGTVSCEGQPLTQNGYSPVQMVFQHPELSVNPRWKIRKVLEEGNRDYDTLLELFNIRASWLDRYPHELSGGELQRITLIRAMSSSTRYLIADEITASLDPSTQALIWQVVVPWAKTQRVGVLAISHNHALLEKICDRIDSCFSLAWQSTV